MDAPPRATPTERRRRQVRWARRLRRIGRAWDNALELARAGRLTAPYGAPFELVHEERVYRLRGYPRRPVPGTPGRPAAPGPAADGRRRGLRHLARRQRDRLPRPRRRRRLAGRL